MEFNRINWTKFTFARVKTRFQNSWIAWTIKFDWVNIFFWLTKMFFFFLIYVNLNVSTHFMFLQVSRLLFFYLFILCFIILKRPIKVASTITMTNKNEYWFRLFFFVGKNRSTISKQRSSTADFVQILLIDYNRSIKFNTWENRPNFDGI